MLPPSAAASLPGEPEARRAVGPRAATPARSPVTATSHVPARLRHAGEVGRWLMAVLLAMAVLAAATVGAALLLGDAPKDALRSTSLLQAHRLRAEGGMDSWGPMASALARWREDTSRSPYAAALALDRCKFQYPPASWLLMEVLPAPPGQPLSCTADGTRGRDIHSAAWAAKPWIATASSLACLALVALSVALAARTWRPRGAQEARPETGRGHAGLIAAGLVAGLAFYPLVKGHTLGQLQVFLNLALGAALLALPWAPRTSGVLVGLCCLFKPQYALFLVWGAWRRQWCFVLGAAAVAVLGHGLALARYGLEVHLQYAQVLQALSRVGEVFWANQSLNGVLNRWWFPAEAASWSPAAFPPLHAAVRWGTLLGSVLLLGAALWRPRGGPAALQAMAPSTLRTASTPSLQLDFALMLCALTLASPIAWEHHYGSFLPVFALMLGTFAAQPRWPARSAAALAVAFVLMAHAVLRPEWIFAEPGQPLRGLLGSHLWLGALIVFALLLHWRARPGAAAPEAAR